MSIAEKLTTIAENEPKVFEAGRASALESDDTLTFDWDELNKVTWTGMISEGINKPIRSLLWYNENNDGYMTMMFTNEDGTSSQSVKVNSYSGTASFVKYENGRVTKGNTVDGIEDDISDTSEGQAVMALYTYDGVTNMTTNGYCNIGYVKSTLKEQYNSGRQAQYDEFWDVYQNYGNGINPSYAFSSSRWTDANYNPKYDLKFTSTNLTNTFWDSKITDTKKPIHAEGCILNNTFRYAAIITIPLLIVDENTTGGTQGFSYNPALKNITIEGIIGNSFNFGTCSALTSASVDSILTHLKDFVAEGSTETRTLTLHSTTLGMLSEETIAEYKEKGWSITA